MKATLMKPLSRAIASGLTVACVLAMASGCHSLPERPAAAPEAPPAAGIDPGATALLHVASNGWHTAVVLPRGALPPGLVPEAADFPAAQWLSFGWGDARYFPAPKATLGMTLRAALLPTGAVIQVTGLPGRVEDTYRAAEVVALEITGQGLRGLARYIDATFERSGGPRASPAAMGQEPFSRFYPATGRFHVFSTCNGWTARALESAGFRVRVSGTITAEDVMSQIRGLARRTPVPRDRITRLD